MIQLLRDVILYDVGWAIIWMPAAHFALGFSVGSLLYWLTLTILRRGFSTTSMGGTCMDDSAIYRYSLLLAVLFSVLLHILEDYTLNVF